MEYGLLKDCEGRIIAESIKPAYIFYCKVGLRAIDDYDEKEDEKVTQEIVVAKKENREPKLEGEGWVFLPESHIPEMLKKIKDEPILSKIRRKYSPVE